MRTCRVSNLLKCVVQRGGMKSIQNHSRKFAVCLGDFNKDEGGNGTEGRRIMQDASTFFSNILLRQDKGIIFTGSGQHSALNDYDRVLMLNFEQNFLTDTNISLFDTKELLDCAVKPSDKNYLMKHVNTHSLLPVYRGVLDFINLSSWQYGFTLNPFSIFSRDERICFMKEKCLYTSIQATSDVINVNDVDRVVLWVSDSPYNERRLILGMKNKGPSKTLICVEKDEEAGDLFRLAVETEWMMKAAALICVKLKRQGNKDVYMAVSPPLQPANNMWVAIQQKKWMKMVKKSARKKDF